MNWKRVYAMELESHTVKIGISKDVAQRMQQVAYTRKEKVINVHFTELAPRDVAARIEEACHETFANRRLFGEYFDITFAEACAELDSYADEIELASIDANVDEIEQIDEYGEKTSATKMTIAESLRRFREKFKFTQDEVARKMKVSRTMYQAYEHGESTPSVKKLVDLADDCQVSLDYLAGRTDQPTPAAVPATIVDDELAQAALAFAAVVQKKIKEQSVIEEGAE